MSSTAFATVSFASWASGGTLVVPLAQTIRSTVQATALAGSTWLICWMGQWGDDDCDEEDPEECQPEETFA